MLWFLLLMMVTACHAHNPITKNLLDRVFIFPKPTNSDNVKLYSSIKVFNALTVCLRIKTDLCRDHTLFSAARKNLDDLVLIYYDYEHSELEVTISDKKVKFKGLKYDLNKWHSICVTWDSATGLVQLWIDGHKTVKEYTSQGPIEKLNIILGQDQDTEGGGYEEPQSFVGEITDVHMWNSVIDACEIQNYIEYQNFCPGNALNWRNLTYHITGSVVTGYYQICPQVPAQVVYPSIASCRGFHCYRNNYLSYPGSSHVDYGHYRNAYNYHGKGHGHDVFYKCKYFHHNYHHGKQGSGYGHKYN